MRRAIGRAAFALALSAAVMSLPAAEYHAGWPIFFGSMATKPNIANIDADPELELIVATAGGIHVFDANGTESPPWPYLHPAGAVGYPLIGDIDGDGERDIVYKAGDWKTWNAVSATGVQKLGWPLFIPDAFGQLHQPHTLADLDQDGADELLLFGSNINFDNRLIHAIRGDGTPLPGWPVEVPYPTTPDIDAYFGDLSVGDVDFDGTLELAVGGYLADGGTWLPSPVFLFEADGSISPGWPVTPGNGTPSQLQFLRPIIADLSGNMSCEVFGCGFYDLHLYSAAGQQLQVPYPLGVGSRPAICGDINGDGSLEIVAPGDRLRIFNSLGQPIAWSPDGYWIYDAITLGDFDGDGCQEVCAVSRSQGASYWTGIPAFHVHLFDQDLVPLPGWPKLIPGSPASEPGLFATALADLDLDNDLEVITYFAGSIHVFDEPNPTGGPVSTEWPMFGHDSKRSGYYHQESTWELRYLPGDANGDGALDLADPIRIISFLVGAWSPTNCTAARDFDGSGVVDLADPITLLGYLFAGQAPPAGAGECRLLTPGTPFQCSRHDCP